MSYRVSKEMGFWPDLMLVCLIMIFKRGFAGGYITGSEDGHGVACIRYFKQTLAAPLERPLKNLGPLTTPRPHSSKDTPMAILTVPFIL
ncbi:hypothetical protein NPIL_624901 [Nephila pilipes]|uniref:Uncharacterized protein n=1 Tax=Nephila pilipes TaxID=299642 RepID=A0A8X6N9Y9_NEPPI|nr:hypothetical protein NPIL_624901 [Nephila pilipes]